MYVLHKTNKLVKIHEVSEKKIGGGILDRLKYPGNCRLISSHIDSISNVCFVLQVTVWGWVNSIHSVLGWLGRDGSS